LVLPKKQMMKNLKIVFILLALTFIIGSCKTKYVKDKPLVVEMIRPVSPGQNYVWLNDNWVFNRKNQTYTRRQGYWAIPKSKKNYQQGYWKTNKNGSHWVPGRWK
jgi:hypothetical protein